MIPRASLGRSFGLFVISIWTAALDRVAYLLPEEGSVEDQRRPGAP